MKNKLINIKNFIVYGFLEFISYYVITFYDIRKTFVNKNELMDIRKKLYKNLIDLCKQLNIKLEYVDNIRKVSKSKIVAGRIHYQENKLSGKYVDGYEKIEILKDVEFPEFVLAHELGHYYSIKYNNDDSEKAANDFAKKICYDFLNKKEKRILKLFIKINLYEV